MSIWVAAWRCCCSCCLAPPACSRGRTGRRLLAATLARFSPIAFASVLAILATGLAQSWFQVEEWNNLFDTAFGRAALIKFGLLVGPLMALGAYNQRRLLPRLRTAAAGGATPGRDGLLLRRSIRTEVALLAVVLGVTAALVSYAPSGYVSSGPQSATTSLGPADLQLTVDPARVGPNEMHVYLTDKQTGQQYDRVKEFNVDLLLPAGEPRAAEGRHPQGRPRPLRDERRPVRGGGRMGGQGDRPRVGVRRVLRDLEGRDRLTRVKNIR